MLHRLPSLQEDARFRLGIDLGGTNIKVGLLDENQQILAHGTRKTLAQRHWKEVADDMIACAREVMEQAGCGPRDCRGIGIGSPGTVDSRNGIVLYSNNFNGWENIPLRAYIEEKMGVPVRISNDANCAALGEAMAGAGRDYQDVVLITLGTGIGSGIVLNGTIFEGGSPGGAELGHTLLVQDGERCTCGRKGCWEAYASATALIREGKKAARRAPESLLNRLCDGEPEHMNGWIPFSAARSGDPAAKQVVDRYIRCLAEGLVNVVNIFRPQVILLSGGICGQGEYLTAPLNERIRQDSFAGKWAAVPEVRIAALGNDAGMVGAANLFAADGS